MVRNITNFLITVITAGFLILSFCRRGLEYPPVFKKPGEKGALPDSIQIFQNGYRTFNLDSCITDEDDGVCRIQWSVVTGPLLTVKMKRDTIVGQYAEIAPLRNQIGKSWVTFTATDPGGLSASKTCFVSIETTDFKWLKDTLYIGKDSTRRLPKGTLISYSYSNSCKWLIHTDTLLKKGEEKADTVILTAGSNPGTTAVYFQITDTVNHVPFHRSSLVYIK